MNVFNHREHRRHGEELVFDLCLLRGPLCLDYGMARKSRRGVVNRWPQLSALARQASLRFNSSARRRGGGRAIELLDPPFLVLRMQEGKEAHNLGPARRSASPRRAGQSGRRHLWLPWLLRLPRYVCLRSPDP